VLAPGLGSCRLSDGDNGNYHSPMHAMARPGVAYCLRHLNGVLCIAYVKGLSNIESGIVCSG
jgi:hypothetical protein